MHEEIMKRFLPMLTADQHRAAFSELAPDIFQKNKVAFMGWTPFFNTFDLDDQAAAIDKMKIVFEHAKKFNLDPNQQFNPFCNTAIVCWNNSPLHNYIANEQYYLIIPFLQFAKVHGLLINLNVKDRENKSPFLFAIKMSNLPIEIISALITPENYHCPDNTGTTPAMYAAALRRIDVMKLILQKEADRLGLGKLNFDALTHDQKKGLSPFVNQQHPESGKSLLHYAVLREGTELDFAKSTEYQLTVLNILKSVAVDGRRDVGATGNYINLDDNKGVIGCSESDAKQYRSMLVLTNLCFLGEKQYDRALLASTANSSCFMYKLSSPTACKYKGLAKAMSLFKGISLSEHILKLSGEMVSFLIDMDIELTLPQKQGNKTAAQYVENLLASADQSTKSDKLYLGPVQNQLSDRKRTIVTERIKLLRS